MSNYLMGDFYFSALALYLVLSIIFGCFSALVAEDKNRDPVVWFLLGLFFGLVALLAICGMGKLRKSKNPDRRETLTIKFS